MDKARKMLQDRKRCLGMVYLYRFHQLQCHTYWIQPHVETSEGVNGVLTCALVIECGSRDGTRRSFIGERGGGKWPIGGREW